MIIQRLYELAQREGLLDDPAFEKKPIPFVVQLGKDGTFLGLQERRGEVVVPQKNKKDAPPKTRPDKGKELAVPKAHGNTANRGFACYLADTLWRVLPIEPLKPADAAKNSASFQTFWNQIDEAADATNDPALRAVQVFGQRCQNDPVVRDEIGEAVRKCKPAPGDRCTFAWHPDEGRTVVERPAVQAWYRQRFQQTSEARQESGPQGFCQVTGQLGPLSTAHTTKLAGVPDGLSSGSSLISNDKPAFESYSLEKAANAGIGYEAAEGYCRALNALLGEKLLAGRSRLKLGNVAALFWTREPVTSSPFLSFENPSPDEIVRLIDAARCGRPTQLEPNDFYCLLLSGNGARAVVRGYLEIPLAEAQRNLGFWFHDLQIVDAFSGDITAAFPLWRLAGTTVRQGDDIPPEVPVWLLRAALEGKPLPASVLAACLQRIRVESGGNQLSTPRMALIKLTLNRFPSEGDSCMTETLDPAADKRSPGYACGRLLALLARCQSPKDFGGEAQILERFFGAASTAPRSVFPQLLRLNRHHLRKIRDEMPGFAVNLERELEERTAPFTKTEVRDPDFPAFLSLAEQGRFALGFYHQRAEYRRQSAENKAARTETAASEETA